MRLRNTRLTSIIHAFYHFIRTVSPSTARNAHSYTAPRPVPAARGQGACSDGPSIAELAANAPALSTLLQAVQATNLTDVLTGPGPLDVFAPTDTAFAKLLESFGNIPAETLLAQTDAVANILKYHVVVEGAVCSGNLSGVVQTVQGGTLTVGDGTVTDAQGQVANIFGSIDAGNGKIYIIDEVLLPPADS